MQIEDKKLFYWGALLAWIPLGVVFLPSLAEMSKGMSENKATGLGAIAGGFAEGLTMFGLLALVVSEVAGIGLLWRSMSREHGARSVGAGLSIGCAGLGLLAIAGAILMMVRMRY
jgi:hypothetical protein